MISKAHCVMSGNTSNSPPSFNPIASSSCNEHSTLFSLNTSIKLLRIWKWKAGVSRRRRFFHRAPLRYQEIPGEISPKNSVNNWHELTSSQKHTVAQPWTEVTVLGRFRDELLTYQNRLQYWKLSDNVRCRNEFYIFYLHEFRRWNDGDWANTTPNSENFPILLNPVKVDNLEELFKKKPFHIR